MMSQYKTYHAAPLSWDCCVRESKKRSSLRDYFVMQGFLKNEYVGSAKQSTFLYSSLESRSLLHSAFKSTMSLRAGSQRPRSPLGGGVAPRSGQTQGPLLRTANPSTVTMAYFDPFYCESLWDSEAILWPIIRLTSRTHWSV